MKKSNLILIFSFAFVITSVVSCSKKDDDKASTGCKNQVITRNDSIIMMGCSNYESEIDFVESGYILSLCEKTSNCVQKSEIFQEFFNSYQDTKMSGGSAMRENGWYVQSGVWEKLTGTRKWKVTASDSFKVIFSKLPLNVTNDNLPVTYNSNGCTVIGPFNASGDVVFEIQCPDAQQAAFTADIYNGVTGKSVDAPNYHNLLAAYNIDVDNHLINNFSLTKTLSLSNGVYLLEVSANSRANWTIKIY